MKDIKNQSKSEAKKAYKAQARKNHPDMGGSEEKMKDVNAAWTKYKSHFTKEAALQAFCDELIRIHQHA